MALLNMLGNTLLNLSRRLGRGQPSTSQRRSASDGALIPITALSERHVPKILKHLLALEPHDRYLRFGYAANDEHIAHYVHHLNFERDEIYGIFNRRLELLAMAHLGIMEEPGRDVSAEFGVSVLARARGRGYGAHLFDRAVIHARNENVQLMYIHALSENAPMIRIARKAGATIERDGPETEAFLRLPKPDLDSRVTELVSDQYAKANYNIKEDVKRFWDFLSKVQEIRNGVRAARHRCAQ